MKLLSGSELAGFIKERQAKSVRGLVQAHNIKPKLAIVVTVENPAIDVYMRMKQRYGVDIGVETQIFRIKQSEATETIKKLNLDNQIHGIIVQLPLENPSQTEEIVNLVAPQKDVDALGQKAIFDPATPMAILWLLAGYNIELARGKNVVLIGRGKLVGAPLDKILTNSGIKHEVVDETTKDISAITKTADVIITGTGQPGLITSEMIPENCVVVDAGVAGEGGQVRGDVDPKIYETRDDLSITPQKGGVGPLTVCSLFENVISAANPQISK
jgi:methylenetetrahydrofolate dehydrogenase (NADP+)/methenyltetrahydrofolate cyclohydrolase